METELLTIIQGVFMLRNCYYINTALKRFNYISENRWAMYTTHGQDKLGFPSRSQQKIGIGFLKGPQSIETVEIGEPKSPQK